MKQQALSWPSLSELAAVWIESPMRVQIEGVEDQTARLTRIFPYTGNVVQQTSI
jgi:hypothetical protein